MRDISLIILADEFLLLTRPWPVEVDDYEIYTVPILFIETNGAPSLALGIKTALTVDEDVIQFPGGCAAFQVLARDERAILTVTGIIQVLVETKIISGPKC